MKREDLILKWLDNNLNSEEQKAFEQLADYEDIIRLNNAVGDFKAPKFDVDKNLKTLKAEFNDKKSSKAWFKPLLRIAAVLAIGFSIYFYTNTLDTNINTTVAQQTTIELPDASSVELNANSSLRFNKSKWQSNRDVYLEGEAFFKVAKGEKFDVITADGVVSVLGTQFNVKQRSGYFEVTCYEGLVAVKFNGKTKKLSPGNTIAIIDGKPIRYEGEITSAPTWITGESSFTNIPLKYVVSELENHYKLTINSDSIDTSRLFTGSFTHKNLDLALKSITIPLNLDYSKSGSSIVLRRE
ncbi:FecR family protein [Winogradskyella alexanderae]|uniref:FecR domain-containing protein n=1 Tax=Winogradskyella alexanderae TaxID=2877123 RepID=A0ABS7XWJ2_9FLAO|nr:FecR domain-containing protein [Winogradskyella alexanderae]MCA0133778.1 FecR domain-containing protein [Winogradskyella alexanderae]